MSKKSKTREHWIKRTTFTAETNAADTHTQRDAERHNTFAGDKGKK